MRVVIETIAHADQRYDTVGDWWWEGETLQMRVSEMGDWRKEMCVAYHEMLEALECRVKDISQAAVDAFDKRWEEHDGIEEPGDDVEAPYYWQHQHAMVAERHLANCLELPWHEHEEAVDSLAFCWAPFQDE